MMYFKYVVNILNFTWYGYLVICAVVNYFNMLDSKTKCNSSNISQGSDLRADICYSSEFPAEILEIKRKKYRLYYAKQNCKP